MNLPLKPPTIDLKSQELQEVCSILHSHVPEHPVWAFGSRVKGTAKAYSDLDLVIISPQPLSLTTMAALKEAFDESDLPMRVDLVDWATSTETFRQVIEQNKVVVQTAHTHACF